MMTDTRASVLIVDDETELADLYTDWLRDDYEVRTAYNGSDALAEFDEDISVVLLDRKMPDMSGGEVLRRLNEQNADCRVAMVTAVEPDFDIVDLGFDTYLLKPASRDELHETLERLTILDTYDDVLQTYYELVSKKALLQTEKNDEELRSSSEYERLQTELETCEDLVESKLEQLGPSEYRLLFHDFDGPADEEATEDQDD